MAGGVRVNEDNTREWGDALGSAIAAALEEVGLVAEGHAKAACPVDTGRLRGSITHVRSGERSESESIGTDVGYARYVELGTSRQKAKPYLRPAATGHADEYRAIFRARLGGGA